MRKCCTLRQSRGAAGELDINGVVHLDGSSYRIQPLATELLPSVQDPIKGEAAGVAVAANRDNVPQLRQTQAFQLAASVSQLGDKLADHCNIVAGLEASRSYQGATSHRAQHVLQLAQAIGGVDVDQNQASLRRRELRDCPFRAVRGPDADAIAWFKAEGQ